LALGERTTHAPPFSRRAGSRTSFRTTTAGSDAGPLPLPFFFSLHPRSRPIFFEHNAQRSLSELSTNHIANLLPCLPSWRNHEHRLFFPAPCARAFSCCTTAPKRDRRRLLFSSLLVLDERGPLFPSLHAVSSRGFLRGGWQVQRTLPFLLSLSKHALPSSSFYDARPLLSEAQERWSPTISRLGFFLSCRVERFLSFSPKRPEVNPGSARHDADLSSFRAPFFRRLTIAVPSFHRLEELLRSRAFFFSRGTQPCQMRSCVFSSFSPARAAERLVSFSFPRHRRKGFCNDPARW